MNSDIDKKIDDNVLHATFINTPFLNVMATRDALVALGSNTVINEVIRCMDESTIEFNSCRVVARMFLSHGVMTNSRKWG